MDLIGLDVLEQDKQWFEVQLEKARQDLQAVQVWIFRLEGILKYNAQLTAFLHKPPEAEEAEQGASNGS